MNVQRSQPAHLAAVLGACALACFGGAACASGAPLQSELARVEALAAARHGAKERACAPEELALADAHLRFAQLELGRGNGARAREHLALAELNARAARILTRDACGSGAEPLARELGAARAARSSRSDATQHRAAGHASLASITTLGRLREPVAGDAHAARARPSSSRSPRPGA